MWQLLHKWEKLAACQGRQLLIGGAGVASLVQPGLTGRLELIHNDVRTSTGDASGPSQETLQGGDGQEILEGECDF